MYFLGINDEKWIVGPRDAIWAAFNIGDILYEGDFQIGLQPIGSKKVYVQPDVIEDYQHNQTSGTVYTVSSKSKGQPDFLAIATVESGSLSTASLYYIKEGEMKNTKTSFNGSLFEGIAYNIRPKTIGSNTIQLMDYHVGFAFEFRTYEFNSSTGVFSYQGSKFFLNEVFEEGKEHATKFRDNPNYFLETPEQRSDYFGW